MKTIFIIKYKASHEVKKVIVANTFKEYSQTKKDLKNLLPEYYCTVKGEPSEPKRTIRQRVTSKYRY